MLVPLLFASAASAQDTAGDEVVVFVLDLSGSMNEPFDGQNTKLDVAKEAFVEAFTNLSSDARVGLRTYGDTIAATAPELREPSCTTDTRVVAPVAPAQRDLLVSQVQGFTALGDTPMGLALQQAATDIPAGATGTIVLFSDGRDECFDADLDGDPARGPSFGQDPCEIARTITNDNPAVDRVVTVGFRADAAAEIELRCIAESTGGSYTAIETPEDARDALPELLVQLSAPREAQRQVGRAIQGGESTETAADLVRLDELGADAALYTDTIAMNSKRFYRLDEYGPEGGTLTATVFGLPAELGIELDMRIFVPQLDERFFQGKHGDFDAGLPARPTASIRCTDCRITGGPYEVYFVVTLDSPEVDVEGTYELEILTEGPGFGGPPTSCSAPQACFYPQEIADLTAELEGLQAELDADIGDIAPAPMIAERDELRSQQQEAEQAIGAATTRAQALEARLPLAPGKSNSFRIPLLLIVLGAVLGFAPLGKLKRSRDNEDSDDDAVVAGSDVSSVSAPISTGPIVTSSEPDLSAGQPLEVGPPPAINQTLGSPGNNWDAELEAAKAALAQQRPLRPNGPDGGPGPSSEIGVDELPASSAPSSPAVASAPPIHGQFTPAQHVAAKAAAEKIAAQHAADAAAAQQTADTPAPTFAPPPGPALATPVPATFEADDHQPAVQATALPPAADPDPQIAEAEQAAAEQAAAEQVAAEQATADQAADRAAAEVAAAEQAAAEQAAADRAAAEQATAEQAAREAAEREAAERAAAEQATAEQAAREAAEQAAAEKAAREAAEQAAAEKAAREAAEQAAAEKAAREAAEREAAEQAAREAAEREAAERAAAEKAAREAAERAAAEKAAAEKAAAEQAAREAAEKAAAEKAAAEQAAREAAERAAAEKAAAEKAAAEQAAREAAERAAADRAAAEKAAAEQAAAEQAAREAAERAAADRAAAEKASADRIAAEEAARQASAERIAAEEAAAHAKAQRETAEAAALQAAAQLAAEEAAAQASAQAAAQAASTSPTANSAQTEEERRQEARRRMLAKQNIVASSSGSGSTSAASVDTAGTSAALRPMTVHSTSDSPVAPVQSSTPDAPGWYEDQAIVGQFRWWDGSTWTGYTSPDDQGPAPS